MKMIKQQRLCVNEDVNCSKRQSVSNSFLSNDEMLATKSKQISGEISKDNESLIETSSSPLNIKKTNKVNVWSKISLKFRFVSHLLHRSRQTRDKRDSIVPNFNSTTTSTITNTARKTSLIAKTTNSREVRLGSIKLPNLLHRKLSIFDRKLSINSNELRTRYKSDSEKDSCSYTDDASNDYAVTLYEITSNSQLNNPTSIKIANRQNDYLYVVNSDNESIDLFNKYDKSLKPYIDTKASNEMHQVRSPVDLVSTNTHVFVTDWLNDEVLVYNNDGQYQTVLSNSTNNKYFTQPWGISIDYFNDYLYVCNTSKNSIEIFNSRLQHYQTLGRTPFLKSTAMSTSPAIEFNTPKWIINCDIIKQIS